MRWPLMRPVIAVALLLAGSGAGQAQGPAPGSVPGLKVAMTIERFDETQDGRDAPLAAGRVLVATVSFSDAATGEPTRGLSPRAFVRRLEPGSPSCGAAAHMVRASGSLSPDDFPLDGRYLVGLAREGGAARLSVTDLAFRLGAANTISVTPLEGAADAMAIGGQVPRAFLLDRAAGRIETVELPAGGAHPFAEGLRAPSGLLPIGEDGLVVAEDGAGALALFDGDGRVARRVEVGPAPLRITASGAAGAVAAAADGSAAIVRDGASAAVLLPAGSLAGPFAADGVALVSTEGAGAALQLRWLDAPALSDRLPLPFRPAGLALAEASGRRYALAWTGDGSPRLAVVDLTLSRLVAELALPDAVAGAARAGSAVVLAHGDPRLVSVVDLGPIAGGAPPFLRRVDIPAAPSGGRAAAGLLVPLEPEPMALYLPPGSAVAYRIAAGGGIANAAMSTVRVQGGAVQGLAAFDRGFAETAPGRFSALVTLPRGGSYQHVATTGPGGTTSSAGFFVEGPGADEAPPAALTVVSIRPPPEPGGKATVILSIRNRPQGLAEGPLALWLHDLGFGAPRRLVALPRPDRTFAVEIARRPGRFSLSVEAADAQIAPAVFDVRRGTP